MSGAGPARRARPGAWRLFSNNRLALAGLGVLCAVVALALLAPLLPLPSPDETSPAQRLLRPLSDGHLLGTDHLGRDILSRLFHGTRTSLAVGASATLAAALLGSLIGLVAGYAGGRTDDVLMRGIDMVMAFPYVLLALAIVAALGPGLMNALLAIAVVNVPFFARNIRGVTLGLARREFIDAARMSGKSGPAILLTEVLPNVLPVIVITMSTTLGWMVLETAGLSFLGLGAQPPQADLGSMLGEGRKLLFTAPHVSIIPGLAIFALVMGINLVGDGMRDMLDPRLKSGSLGRPAPATRVERGPGPGGDADPARGSPPLLEVRGLRTEFTVGDATHVAVGGVGFDLRPGESLGIVGESGSGKSVTARSLLGLVPTPPGKITGGRVLYHGEDLLGAPFGRLRQLRGGKVAYVFQDPMSSLHPLITVGDQVAEAIRAHQPVGRAEAWEQAVRLLGRVLIPNPAQRARCHPHEFSGGMRQRVGIAMALANDAEILVADEPTTALDVTVQSQILALLRRLREESGVALLFITHDFGVVSEMCDRVAVMYAGRIVEIGPTQEVLADPRHPYTRKLIDCVPVMGTARRRLDSIPGLPPMLDRLPKGCAFADRCPFADGACRAGDIGLGPAGPGRQVRCLRPLGIPA